MRWLDIAAKALPRLIELGVAIRKAVIKRRIERERVLQDRRNREAIEILTRGRNRP